MKKIKKLLEKFRKNLMYRLLAAVLVFILPVCIVAVWLTLLVMTRASEQVVATYQLQLDSAMKRLEEDTLSIDVEMDQFVYDYISELNLSGYKADEITAYAMLGDLTNTMERSGQSGYVSICDQNLDKILIRGVNTMESAGAVDELQRMLKLKLRTNEFWESYDHIYEKKHYFLAKNYLYQNYQIVFWFDLGDNIVQDLTVFYEGSNEIELLVYGGDQVYRIEEGGEADVVEKEWKNCMKSNLYAKAVSWEGETIPIQVCMRANIQTWQIIPPGYWVLFAVTFICLGMIFFLWHLIRIEVIIPIECLNHAMHEIQQENLDYRIENHEVRNSEEVQYLYDTFDKMAKEVQLSSEKDKKMYQTQMDNLRLQVNPHMLLNSFSTIYSLAQTKNYACIQDYSLHLVDYFRYALRKNEDMVPLYQELDFVQNYIEIQKIRFPKAFSSVYSVAEVCMKALIPPLLIENFVENAMKYALKPGEIVEVLLNIRKEEDRLMISISDTGRGIKPEILEQLQSGKPYIDKMGNKHIGVWNCQRRVELYYGEKAKLNIISTLGEGTQVFMNIPFVEEKFERKSLSNTELMSAKADKGCKNETIDCG